MNARDDRRAEPAMQVVANERALRFFPVLDRVVDDDELEARIAGQCAADGGSEKAAALRRTPVIERLASATKLYACRKRVVANLETRLASLTLRVRRVGDELLWVSEEVSSDRVLDRLALAVLRRRRVERPDRFAVKGFLECIGKWREVSRRTVPRRNLRDEVEEATCLEIPNPGQLPLPFHDRPHEGRRQRRGL